MTDKELIKDFKDLIVRLDDTADAEDYHAFVACLEDHYRDGFYHEVYRFMIRQTKHVDDLEKKLRVDNELFEMQVKQNRRYKQALEEILTTDDFEDILDYIDRVTTIAGEALQDTYD